MSDTHSSTGFQGSAPDWRVFDRYLRGVMTEEDREQVDAYFASADEDRRALDRMRRHFTRGRSEGSGEAIPWLQGAPWRKNEWEARRPLACIERVKRGDSLRSLHKRVRPSVALRMAFLAVFLIVVGTLATNRWWHWPDPAVSHVREYHTGNGERALVYLPDGSEVTLGPASHLRYSEPGNLNRIVSLSGQAYFAVAHDAQHPFRVRTENAIVDDIGTAFVVTHYPGDTATQVVIASGEVQLRSARDSTKVLFGSLRRGDNAHVSNGSATLIHNTDISGYLAWMSGQLVFRDASLSDVVRRLSRWYDIDVQIDSSVHTTDALTASFNSQSLGHVLALITQSLGLRYERHGRIVTVFSKPCPGCE